MILQVGCDGARLHDVLDDAGVLSKESVPLGRAMLEAPVLADEHPQLVVVRADVGVEHLLG